MNATALLAELAAADIHLTRVGEDLKVRAKPDVLARYRERIAANKRALLEVLNHSVGQAVAEVGAPQPPVDRRILTQREAIACGLDPQLTWMRVSQAEVEATRPPHDWDGTLPAGCRYSQLCRTLGPCRHCHDQETKGSINA
jgi:hypothetical protein